MRTSVPTSPITLPTTLNGYPGSKSGSGVAERIIRQMPPHQVYIEAFAGSAAIFRRKLPAAKTILIDVDPKCCHRLRSYIADRRVVDSVPPYETALGEVEVVCGDFLDLAPLIAALRAPDTLAYFDPPYLRAVRSDRVLYDFDSRTEAFHQPMLELATRLECKVMISGYASALYERVLKRWRFFDVPTMTRGGKRIERVWCNFDEPPILHDPRQAGGDYRQRERIKRKQRTWMKRFLAVDPRERQAIAVALVQADRAAVEAAVGSSKPAP